MKQVARNRRHRIGEAMVEQHLRRRQAQTCRRHHQRTSSNHSVSLLVSPSKLPQPSAAC